MIHKARLALLASLITGLDMAHIMKCLQHCFVSIEPSRDQYATMTAKRYLAENREFISDNMKAS